MSIRIQQLGQAYPMTEDAFTAKSIPCPHGIPDQRFADLVRLVQEMGWDQAWWEISNALRPDERTSLEQAAGVEGREGWQYLVPLSPDAIALDLGGGWGPLSCSLAEKVGEVYSVDPNGERLELLRARAEQRGLSNLHYVQGGDTLPLPFPDHFFELVNMGGVLERIPSLIAGDPRRVQIRLLQEVRRVVKPAGQVFAGAENRFALKYLQGKAQAGVEPRCATLMPRWLADLVGLLTRGRTYRSYTYSRRGTERLFREAGFASVQTLLLAPGPRDFDRVLASGDPTQMAAFFKIGSTGNGLGKRLLARTGVLSWLAPAFGVVGSPGPDIHHFLEQIVSQVNSTQKADYRIAETSLRDYGGCIVFLEDRDEPSRKAILKLAFDHGGENHLDLAARNVAPMAKTLKGRPFLMPRVLESGTAQGHAYVLEERLRGYNGWQMMSRGWSASRLADTVWDFVEAWMRSTRATVRLSEAEFSRWVPFHPEQWRRLVGPQTTQAMEDLIQALRAYMVDQERVVVASHGDLSLGNVLFDGKTGTIEGIVDWDSADVRGLPLVDAISLSQYRDGTPFDLGFPDEFAEEHTVAALAETLRRVSTCPAHPRLAATRTEYGCGTDRDAFMALFVYFLKRHQPGSLALRKQTRKWVEAWRLLLAVNR